MVALFLTENLKLYSFTFSTLLLSSRHNICLKPLTLCSFNILYVCSTALKKKRKINMAVSLWRISCISFNVLAVDPLLFLIKKIYFWLGCNNLWDLSSLTRGQTWTLSRGAVITTGPPGNVSAVKGVAPQN